jgi:hypothetical protein
LLPVLFHSDIPQKAQTQTPAQRKMVAFVTMRPIYLPNDGMYLLVYQQLRLERAMGIEPLSQAWARLMSFEIKTDE